MVSGTVMYSRVQCTQAGCGRSRVGKVHGKVLRGILVRVLVLSSCSLAPRDRAQVANALADVPAPSVSLWLYLVPYRTWSAWIRMHDEDACQRDPCGVISTVHFLFFSFLFFWWPSWVRYEPHLLLPRGRGMAARAPIQPSIRRDREKETLSSSYSLVLISSSQLSHLPHQGPRVSVRGSMQ